MRCWLPPRALVVACIVLLAAHPWVAEASNEEVADEAVADDHDNSVGNDSPGAAAVAAQTAPVHATPGEEKSRGPVHEPHIDSTRVFQRRAVGPHDQATVGARAKRRDVHAATLAKLGAVPGASADVCSPALFEVHEIAHPTANAQFSWGAMDAQAVLTWVLAGLQGVRFTSLPLAPFANVDGRNPEPALATMGGDVAELLLALAAFAAALEKEKLPREQVSLLILDYLLNTDTPSLTLQVDSNTVDAACAAGCCAPTCGLDRVPADLAQDVLKALKKSGAQGSAHFRHILQNPIEFGLTTELTIDFIGALYELMWGIPKYPISNAALSIAQSKLRLAFMAGEHAEGALVHVRTQGCAPSRTPMLPAQANGRSLFLMYPDAVQHRRALNADWLAETAVKMNAKQPGARDRDFLVARMNELANKQYLAAIALDDGKTPTFSLNFPSACCS